MEAVAETGSTNADLLREAEAGAGEGRWLRAERQTGGRGRLGRRWSSPPGNLYASTIVRLRPDDPSPPTLALVAGIAMHATALSFAGAAAGPLRLKWPNDLMADGAKLGGILVERSGSAAVIGFGLNLAHAPRDLGRACACFVDLGIPPPDPANVADELARSFAEQLACWRTAGLATVRARWLARAHPVGMPLIVTIAGEPALGQFAGLAEDGALLLTLEDGTVRAVHAGDVGLG